MNKIYLALLIYLSASGFIFIKGQSRTYDINKKEVPQSVLEVLKRYVEILSTSEDLESCAESFTEVAGGSLVNEDGKTLRSSVKPYSLKKDFNNIKFYSLPVKITRVNSNPGSRSSGFGASAIRGRVYKIWIDKSKEQNGMPAPISILVPENHSFIKTPKIIGIGSL